MCGKYIIDQEGNPIVDEFGTLTQMNAYVTTNIGKGSTWYVIDGSNTVTDIYKWSGKVWCKL